MTTTKHLGICMDHFSARLMTFTNNLFQTTIIASKRGQQTQAENLPYDKEQRSHYYKKVSASITNFDDVILFGPTDTKIEFLSFLIEEKCLPNIKIRIKYTDTMTDFQQQNFVLNYFSCTPFTIATA